MATITPAQTQFEGMPPGAPPVEPPPGRRGRSNFLPVRPLRRWLRDYVIRAGGPGNAAFQLDTQPRTLWRILRDQSYVTVDVADRILTAAGEPQTFYLLYPLDDAEADVGPWALESESMFGESSFEGAVYERWCRWCSNLVTTDHRACCPDCRRLTQPLTESEGAF